MKIICASDVYYPTVNGSAVATESSVNYLAEQGHEVHVIAPEYPKKDERVYPSNIIIHRFPSYNLFFTTNKEERFVYPKYQKKIHQLLDELDPDVVHIHLEFAVGIATRSWAIKNKKPLVMTAYTDYPPHFKLYVPYLTKGMCFNIAKYGSRWFYKPADKLIVITEKMQSDFVNKFGLKNEMELSPIGLDESHYKGFDKEKEKVEALKEYPQLKDKKVLLMIGRIGEDKNIGFLLQMFKKLLDTRKDLHLLLVGGGSHIDFFKNMASELGLDEYITFVGYAPHEELRKYYALADVFTYPGVIELNLVVKEALYLGIPTTVIKAFGIENLMKNEAGGFVVEKEDADMYAEKVNLLLNDEKLYKTKVEEALKLGQELVFARTGESLVKIYNEVINKHKQKNKI